MLILNGVVRRMPVGRRRFGTASSVSCSRSQRRALRAGGDGHAGTCPAERERERSLALTIPSAQLVFTAIVSTLLYATFVFVQTIRHRDYFLPEGVGRAGRRCACFATQLARGGTSRLAFFSSRSSSVVFLAKSLSKPLETAIAAAALPRALVGIARRRARSRSGKSCRHCALRGAAASQTSLNLALGSALATIGLTIPTVAIAALVMGWPLSLGLDPTRA